MDARERRERLEALFREAVGCLPLRELDSLTDLVLAGEDREAMERYCARYCELQARMSPAMEQEARALAAELRVVVPAGFKAPRAG